MRMTFDELKGLMKAGFIHVGFTEENAEIMADNLAVTEARGMYSHGFQMAARYMKFVTDGPTNPNPQISVRNDYPSCCVVDGDRGMGGIVVDKAVDIAVEKARKTGSATVLIVNTYHYGCGAVYAEKAAREGMMSYLYSSNSGKAAPFGGTGRYYGTNPYTFGAPAGKYGNFILDMATTETAMGKIYAAAKEGRPLPEGLAMDQNGNPTTDAELVLNGGALRLFGGHKGYGIAMMTLISGGVLSGANYHKDDIYIMGDQGLPTAGSFLQVTDIDKFVGVEAFNRRMEDLIEELKTSKPAPGFDRVYFPGEIENLKLADSLKNGINVSDVAYRTFRDYLHTQGMEI